MQVNVDFESEQDMVEKARIGLALQPVATALFANSPLRDGKPTGQQAALSTLAFSMYKRGRTQFIHCLLTVSMWQNSIYPLPSHCVTGAQLTSLPLSCMH